MMKSPIKTESLLIFFKRRIFLIIFLCLYFLITIVTYKDFGLTADEYFVYTRGKYFYTKVRGNDPFLQKGFAVKDRNNEDLLFNNSTYPAFLYIFNGKGNIEKYHLLNFVMASVIFLVIYEILLYIYKKPILALLGPVFLFCTPRFYGDIAANPKDIPFAIFYFLCLSVMYFGKNWEQKKRILILGSMIGITASFRIIGLSLLLIYILFIVLISWMKIDRKHLIVFLKDLFFETILISLVTLLFLLISMPYIASDPFNHLIELLKVGKNYPWYGSILFFGKHIPELQKPILYLPVWFMITTPLFILLLAVSSFFVRQYKEAQRLKNLLFLSIIIQLIIFYMFKPTIYNGIRHYLFLLPQIVVLAAISFIEIINKKKYALIIIFVVCINIFFVIKSYIQLHPYEYIYFNSLVHGVRGASGLFELDYWNASEKEALHWLDDYLNLSHIPQTTIYTCSKSYSLSYYMPNQIDSNTHPELAHYIVCDSEELANKIMSGKSIKLLKTIKRQNIPLQFIYSVD